MKTSLLALAAPLVFATACEAAVGALPDASTSGNSTTGTVASSSSAADTDPSAGSTGSPPPGETDDLPDPSSDSSSDTSGSSAPTDASSTTGPPIVCDSPLLDSEDRLALLDAPMRGNPDALVTLVVWTGYADPFSRTLQSTLAALADGPFTDDLRIVSKQMPLPFQDPRSVFARAGLAAHALGAYWPFHDAMFAFEDDLDAEVVDAIAVEVGLDLETFHEAMESPEVATRLSEDMALFADVGGSGTPSTVLNGQFITGAQPQDTFEQAIAAQRAAIQALIDEGTPPCLAFEQRLDAQLP